MASGTQIGSIYYDLDLDSSKFDSGVSSAKAKAKGLGSDLSAYFDKATQASKTFAVALAGVTTALAGGIGYGLKVAGDLEAAEQGFKALLGSSEKAGDTMARIKKEAKATPFELTGLVAGTQALTAITKDGNKAVDILLDVGKAIAISGKGQAEMDRVILNLQGIAATGKVAERDIWQFQTAIPIFNDILKASGLTTEELKNSENAAELLFEAFKKAGQEGGITARGFIEQSGTFNQLLSNVKDSLTILGSEFVKQTGIFDFAKGAMSAFIGFLETKAMPGIISLFGWMKDNLPIVAGIILGALFPALVALAGSVWAVVAPLLPFIALGIAIGFIVQALINHFGGLDNIMKLLQPTIAFLKELVMFFWNELGKLWNQIKVQLIPALQALWNQLEPVLMPVLKVLGVIIGSVVIGAIYALIYILRGLIWIFSKWAEGVAQGIENLKTFWNWLSKTWYVQNLIDNFKDFIRVLKTVWDWLSKIWEKVSSFTSNAVGKIKGLFGGERADGGYVQRGVTYLVGERGPELFTPSGSGNIIPNKELGGSVNKSINVNINPGFLIGSPSEARELGRIAYDEIKRLETAGAI